MIQVQIAQVGLEALPILKQLNRIIFGDENVIARMDRDDMVILIAHFNQQAVGFKVGYLGTEQIFYSAKGGILPEYRRQGIARKLLHKMMEIARQKGYKTFVYDTFPNLHPGMTIIGLKEGFRVTNTDFNQTYKDYCLRFEKPL
jgi:predicted GNAT superfamily acetyltransferase